MTLPVRVFRRGDLVAADPTPGVERQAAFELRSRWAGQVTTAPGTGCGWHHHDRNETSLYVGSGVLRLEFEGYEGHLDAHAGDFIHVPAFTIHRESNPGDGVPTVNGDAPPPHA